MFHFRQPEWLASVDSTSTYIRARLGADSCFSGTVVAAVEQTAGRGRMGNVWFSRAGRDLTFSFLWRGNTTAQAVGSMSLVCGLATVEFLRGLGVDAKCKWPNDIMLDKGKLGGILCESISAGSGGVFDVIVGIGLNIGKDPSREIGVDQPVACLEDVYSGDLAPASLLDPLLRSLQCRIRMWMAECFETLRHEYSAVMWGIGGKAVVRVGSGKVTGIVQGIGVDGRLLLDGSDGKRIEVGSVAAVELLGGCES